MELPFLEFQFPFVRDQTPRKLGTLETERTMPVAHVAHIGRTTTACWACPPTLRTGRPSRPRGLRGERGRPNAPADVGSPSLRFYIKEHQEEDHFLFVLFFGGGSPEKRHAHVFRCSAIIAFWCFERSFVHGAALVASSFSSKPWSRVLMGWPIISIKIWQWVCVHILQREPQEGTNQFEGHPLFGEILAESIY